MALSPIIIAKGRETRPHRIPALPRPMKKTTIMPRADQRSAIHPAGSAQRPTSSAPSVQSSISSW